ncbi:TetR/AcrR family transcriptional regulator [Nonomuraea sp. NPDC050643]|uniref:TetR/AcrR family transcriptional regulator n=1 Tax=Nonomuraea sp. NPDC050643 TaxID=3155660 RepID=UPI00340ACEFC
MSTDALGLREQKKRETRQVISDHATQLFLEHGFDRTTIADIAAAARVAKMTVTNYFPRKEDLALDHHEAFVAGLAETVARRPAGESALGAVRRLWEEALARRDPVVGFTGREFAQMIADSPTLVARLRDLHEQREEALARHLANETAPGGPTPGGPMTTRDEPGEPVAGHGEPVAARDEPVVADGGTAGSIGEPTDAHGEPVLARAVAAQLAAADRLLFRDLQARTLAGQGDDEIATALSAVARRVFGLLEPAIGDYAVH